MPIVKRYQYEKGVIILDQDTGYRLRANHKSKMTNGYFLEEVITNQYGLRDINNSNYADLGLVAIGDSQTFGHGIPAADTWVEQLQELLHVNVVNAGVGGYGVTQYQAVIERMQPHYKIKHVLYAMSWNDVSSGSVPPDIDTVIDGYLVVDPKYRKTHHNFKDSAWYYYLFRRTAVGILLRNSGKKLLSFFNISTSPQSDRGLEKEAAITRGKIEKLSRFLKKIGADLTIVHIANGNFVRPEVWSVYSGNHRHSRFFVKEFFAEWSRVHDIYFVDVITQIEKHYLAAENDPTSIMVPFDGHYNGGANKIIAQAFADLLAHNRRYFE